CMGEELFVCIVIRWTTCAISSALKRENMTRCSVWQFTQPASDNFCSRVPGTLMSHSPLESCVASFELLVTLWSCRSRWAPCAVTSTEVFGSSYPTARMLMAYLPGSSLSRGKLYWPWALLTTQTVMVEPAFFAPTITPSIAPSDCEVTLPVSAAEDGVCVIARPAKAKANKVVSKMVRASSVLIQPSFSCGGLSDGVLCSTF